MILVFALGIFPIPVLQATAEPVQRILDAIQGSAGLTSFAWPW